LIPRNHTKDFEVSQENLVPRKRALAIAGVWVGLRIALRSESPLLVVDFAGMRPALGFGDVIMVQGAINVSEVNAAPEPEGDIVVFRKPSEPAKLIMRRVIAKTFEENAWYLRTQVDESSLPDLWGEWTK
jgi:hypothetical protein